MTRRAVVLAGGDSRRFGDRDKALAHVAGEPMIRLVARAATAATDAPPVVAVASAERAATYGEVLDSAEFVLDAPRPDGPIGGLRATLDRTTAGWVFVCGCDMPWLTPSAIEWLFDRRDEAEAVVPRTERWLQPLHAWYRRSALERAMAADVDRLRRLCQAVSETTFVAVDDAPDDVPLATSVRNVNTSEDLDRD